MKAAWYWAPSSCLDRVKNSSFKAGVYEDILSGIFFMHLYSQKTKFLLSFSANTFKNLVSKLLLSFLLTLFKNLVSLLSYSLVLGLIFHGDNLQIGSSSKQQYISNSHVPILNKRKKREVLLNDVGSASSRAEDQNIEMLTNNSVPGTNPSLDTFTSVRKSKAKSKQKRSYVLASGDGLQSSCTEAAHPASTSACASSLSRTIVANVMNRKSELSKEEKEKEKGKEKEKDLADFSTEQLTELGSFENEDYSSLLDFEEDGLQDQDLLGLEIPMDNLSDVHMFI